ncbi:hypothetical protein [Nocardia tengchongensis]|uniref:hypothetical protein n=1 Tax=Nocardia tengchongensis TaxID=2055889 RepID=UPI0036B30789
MPDRSPTPSRHVIRNLRTRLRSGSGSGPRSTLRVVTLTHPLLDPGFAYWAIDDESPDA